MTIGSGIFRALTDSTSVTMANNAVRRRSGGSREARDDLQSIAFVASQAIVRHWQVSAAADSEIGEIRHGEPAWLELLLLLLPIRIG